METPSDRIVDVLMTELRNGLSRQQLCQRISTRVPGSAIVTAPTSLIPSVLCERRAVGNHPFEAENYAARQAASGWQHSLAAARQMFDNRVSDWKCP